MIKRLFISDTHSQFPKIGPEFDQHDLIMVGDMVDNGSEYEYVLYDRWLAELKRECRNIYMVPGNHDLGQAGLMYSHKAEARWIKLKEKYSPNIPNEKGFRVTPGNSPLILLDSCLHTASPHDFAQGKAWNLEQVGRYLDEEHKKTVRPGFTTIVLHHDPLSENTTLLLKNAGRFMAETVGFVNFVFYGHTHIPIGVDSYACYQGTHFYACPALIGGGETWEQVIGDDGAVSVNVVEVAE